MDVLVYEKPDGKLLIIHKVNNSQITADIKTRAETANSTVAAATYKATIDSSSLPATRTNRDTWNWNSSTSSIDET